MKNIKIIFDINSSDVITTFVFPEIIDKEEKDEAERTSKANVEDMAKIKVELDACKEKYSKGTRPFLDHLV